jgi:hypothetical protein
MRHLLLANDEVGVRGELILLIGTTNSANSNFQSDGISSFRYTFPYDTLVSDILPLERLKICHIQRVEALANISTDAEQSLT